jgi:hypothetical protein
MKSGRGLLWTVGVLLVGTGAALAAVGAAVVKGSRDVDVRSGLDYEGFLASVDELLEVGRADTLVDFDRLSSRLPDGRTVTWDTLMIRPQASHYPSLRRGGFLYDQVRAYNRFQRERLTLAAEQPTWFDRLAAYNPSIFRAYRDVDGAQRLTRSAAAWSLRVPSPFEGRWSGEVRASDSRRGAGLMGPGVAMSLRRPTRLYRSVEGRRQRCEFEPSAMEVRAFCLSEQRRPQAIFRLAENDPTPRTAIAGWSDLWVDGGRVAPGDSIAIREGSVIQLDPLEPMLLGELWEGVLSSEQWVNGRDRRVGTLPPPLDLFGHLDDLGVVDPAADSDSPVEVTVSAGATMELTRRLQSFVDRRIDLPVEVAMIVLARVPDGEVVAMAEVGRRRSPGRSALMEPMAPGSAVKPLIAAAVLSQRADLGSLEIPARSGDVRSVLGLPPVSARRAISSTLNCAAPNDGWIDLRHFLRCSNNEYAASILMAGLLPADAWRRLGGESSAERPRAGHFRLEGSLWSGLRPGIAWPGGAVAGEVDRSVLLTSPLATGMAELFDLAVDPVVTDRSRRTDRIWNGLRLADGTPVSVSFEGLPAVSRPVLLSSSASSGTEVGLLYRYSVGAWENRWTLLDLTSAFGRLATDRRMDLRFSSASFGDEGPGPLGLRDTRWFPDLLAGLRDVSRDGTASGLARDWERLGLPRGLLAKTGTLSEPGEPGRDDDLFSKTLLFAVGESAPDGGRRLSCGIVGGIYLRFAEGPRGGALPSYQVEFARDELGDFMRDHWEELGLVDGGCSSPAG